MMMRGPLNRMLPAAGRTTSFVFRMDTHSSESVRPTFAKTARPFPRLARPRLSRLSLIACHSVCLEDSVVAQLPGLPPNNTAVYGTHCFQPEFLGRAVDLAVSGLGEEVSDIGVFVGLVRSLKENGGLVAQSADLVALAPHPAVGPFLLRRSPQWKTLVTRRPGPLRSLSPVPPSVTSLMRMVA